MTKDYRKLKLDELNRLSKEEYQEKDKSPIVVVLDNIRSMNNVGSVFRTSDCFRIEKIMLCGITATPPHREIRKTAIGAEETVEWEYFKNTTDAISNLQKEGYKIAAIEQTENSIGLSQFNPEEKTAIVFGNEVDGVAEEVIAMCDTVIEIPQFGTKHSFNIAVSAGIVIWEMNKNKII
jgi:tRNA G18 (ribose-2'-O)-methylase SpoU